MLQIFTQNMNNIKKVEKDYGYVMTDSGKIKIESFVKAMYIDTRLISVALLEDKSYVLAIENPESSGRCTQQIMRLSEESLIGLISTVMMFFRCSNISIEELLSKATNDNRIDYSFSDNLMLFKP